MSNLDTNLDIDAPYDPVDFITSSRRQTIGNAITSLGDDDPVKAGRAYELSRATGEKPALIYPDLENYETQHRAGLTANLLENNAYLREYIAADPMRAKLSADDWANLDDFTTKLSTFRKTTHESILGMPTRAADAAWMAAWKGFREGVGEGPIGGWTDTVPFMKNDLFMQKMWAAAASPVEVPFRLLGGVIHGATEATKAGAEVAYAGLTGDEQGASRFARDLAGIVEQQMTGQGVHGAFGDGAAFVKYASAMRKAKLWLDNGVEPPKGIDPLIDRAKKEQNDADVASLEDTLKSAEASATRQRDPATFADLVRMRDKGTISIDGDAVLRLYGDKPLGPEDGLLGWAPRIGEQIELARASGGDIEIPTADFYAHMPDNMDVFKALKDDIRVRPGGITKNEAKLDAEQKEAIEAAYSVDEEAKPGPREILPDDLPTIRAAGGLEPMFSIGDRKLTIQKEERRPDAYKVEGTEFHNFNMFNEAGQQVGYINISRSNAKPNELYVDMIGGSRGYSVQDFGFALMRDLKRQLKAEFPDAEWLVGHRVTGMREKFETYYKPSAMVRVRLDADDIGAVQSFRDILSGGQWKSMGMGLEAYVKPEFTGREKEIIDAIEAERQRLTSKQVDVFTPQRIRKEDTKQNVRGVHTQYTDRNPWISVALDSDDPIGVYRHEAIHHLRQQGFFTGTEWAVLERAAREQSWIEKFGIERRYSKLDNAAKLEEAIADGFREWKKNAESVPEAARPIYARLKELFDAIKLRLKEIFGRDLEWNEIFQRMDEGEIGRREGNAPRREGAHRESVDDDPSIPPPLFRTPGTIGMSAREHNLRERRMQEQHEADMAYEQAKAEKAIRKEQSAEWRTEKKNVRAEVEADFDQRPDVAADIYFARGEIYGERGPKPKMDPADVPEELRGALPKDWFAKPGAESVNLEDVASLTGYPTARSMLEDLARYNSAKLAANMSAKAFRDRMVELEVDRRMTDRFGNLEENILDAAKDHVTSMTEMNKLSDDMLMLGSKAGLTAPILKGDIKRAMHEAFEEMPMAGQSSDKYLRASEKLGTASEIHNLKGEHDAAYREKQKQYYAMTLMGEARTLEKEQKQLAKLGKRLAKREVKGLDQETHDWIQTLMWQAGMPSRRSMPEIQRSQAISGADPFPQFIERITGDGWAPEVGPEIVAGRVKPMGQMTVGEFREFKAAIDSLNYIGRQMEKITIEGEKRDFAEWRTGVIANITSRPQRSRESQEAGFMHRVFQADAEMTRVENWMKELDLGEDMGPLVNTIIRPMAEAKHKEYSLQEKLSTDIKALPQPKEWKRTLDEALPNTWFKDPTTGDAFKLTRNDLIGLMLNWGNRSNIRKVSRGYGSPDPTRGATRAEADAFEAKMKEYIDAHATKQDWDFVQGVWDIYKGFQKDMEVVWRNTSGTQPKLVEPVEVETPHGRYAGGYYPLLRDWYLSGTPKAVSDRTLFGPDYPNYSTPQGHLKERTGASYFVDFRQPLGNIPLRMQQVMHDIAYRDAVMAAQKVISDKQIMAAIRQHYGAEYEVQLRPWLERIAKAGTMDEANLNFRDKILRQTRMNLINYALPFNYVVLATPDVGTASWKGMANYLRDKTGNDAIANKWSKEIPHAIYNMDRDFREAMQKAVAEGKMDQAKAKAVRWGYGPVSWVSKQFRTATFIEKFNEAREKGMDEAKAAAVADSYVRERHATASIADLPPIMASGEAGRLLTMFYGYWNTQWNWLRTTKGDVERGEYMKALQTVYGTIIIGSAFGAAIANQAREEDTVLKRVAKAVPLQLLGMVPYGVREAATYAFEGIPPRSPTGSAIQATGATVRDIVKVFRKEPVEKGIRHTTATLGMLFGIPGTLQAGRTAQGIYDVAVGKQRPRDFMEWVRLIATGEARLKRQGER